jgi:2-iminobutanoate/2-iminopropanoate deaminase
MAAIERIISSHAAPAKGPYSHAVKAGGFVFVSGMGPVDPKTGEPHLGPIEEQVRLTLSNVRAVLEDAGASLQAVVRTTVYLRDMDDFARMNAIYAEHFGDAKPARTTIQAARLPLDIGVEIEAIAWLG